MGYRLGYNLPVAAQALSWIGSRPPKRSQSGAGITLFILLVWMPDPSPRLPGGGGRLGGTCYLDGCIL